MQIIILKLCRIEEYEAALKEWEENKPPGSASSLDPVNYKKRSDDQVVSVSFDHANKSIKNV